ncbi:pseudouridine synthase [Bacillus sp. FJAT-45350]|uniref:pseudouridine synthase n=1 Tax=Bacillus sp. FJAT-45350 TaxID=2011014 RepID=UPI000BB9B8EA|nr:pseudouridine synthase [Bacillus sp. FJAT-45350]
MRINKYISLTGYCSRRETDRLIDAKRITINGKTCVPGDSVEPGDTVLIDHKPIPMKEESIYLAFYKPVGITCTAQKLVKDNIIDYINFPTRVFPVGRLDKASEGLILLTNDGDIVNKMMRSENNHQKEYIVTVDKSINSDFIKGMSNGVKILSTITNPCIVTKIDEHVFSIILTQGLNRQIRRMCKVLGYKVVRLQRVRIMNITSEHLEVGQWRYLTDEELSCLKNTLK